MIFVVWGLSLRKRGRRLEDKYLGEVDAESLDAAQLLAADRWPGVRLEVREQSRDLPTTPKSGCPRSP
jgi:hypothetical protein